MITKSVFHTYRMEHRNTCKNSTLNVSPLKTPCFRRSPIKEGLSVQGELLIKQNPLALLFSMFY